MDYQSINKKKEEFRKYLEKGGVVDAITKVLVMLYEEPERPQNPLEYIRDNLTSAGGGGTLLKEENERLKKEVDELRRQIEDQGVGEEEEEVDE